MNAPLFPISPLLPQIQQQLAVQPRLVLEAPPGAGKTTQVPLALLDAPWLQGRKIILLEPRRVAARSAALFMARQLGEEVGGTVGYRIRFENKVSARTRIEVVTEGILTRMLQDDPMLETVGAILFDEFHERHLSGDLGLALALRAAFMRPAPLSSAALLVTGPLLALCKGVYLPLMAAGLRWRGPRDARLWLILGAMALGVAAFMGWMHYSGGSQALYHIQSRKTGETMMTAPLRDQLAVILADPVSFIRILAASVIERAPVYALQIVGRFGWNAILLPLLAYPLALLMLGAGIACGSGARFGTGQRLWWLAIAAGVALLIETAMYLTGTPLGAEYIQGTQGRYFLPVLTLVLLALSPARGVVRAQRLLACAAIPLLLIAAACVFDSFWIHGFVTADGMPPHDSIIRALLLPSPRW